jgi:hypothetical protein
MGRTVDRDAVFQYLIIALVALWGGVVSYYRRVVKGELKHAIWRMLGELTVSAGAGMGVALLMLDAGAPTVWATACGGIAGHMGGRVFDIGEEILANTLQGLAGKDRRNTHDRRSGADRRNDTE